KISRISPDYVRALITKQIPEVQQGLIKIEKVVRIAGIRTKVAVSTTNLAIDPATSIFGYDNNRINTITSELNNSPEHFDEKIDIIRFSSYLESNVVNAFTPAQIEGVYIYQTESERNAAVVVVDDDESSKRRVFGKKQSNFRLAKLILGLEEIRVLSVSEAISENVPFISIEEIQNEFERIRDRERRENYLRSTALVTPKEDEVVVETVNIEPEPIMVEEEAPKKVKAKPTPKIVKPVAPIEAPVKVVIETKSNDSFLKLEQELEEKSRLEKEKADIKKSKKAYRTKRGDDDDDDETTVNKTTPVMSVYSDEELHDLESGDYDDDDFDEYDYDDDDYN
ncbi:MAG: hypothetical protein LBR37_04525, partial [Erysipelotrichaceae bacterium]|nr:hypothetical protein [Erysipelotrichaceae bacterium]